LSDGSEIGADMVLASAGVRPDTELAEKAGIKLGTAGAICVNTRMETSAPDIYACGDCIEQYHAVTGCRFTGRSALRRIRRKDRGRSGDGRQP
jgi:NAD(P)H-nitrite reductase large subunit